MVRSMKDGGGRTQVGPPPIAGQSLQHLNINMKATNHSPTNPEDCPPACRINNLRRSGGFASEAPLFLPTRVPASRSRGAVVGRGVESRATSESEATAPAGCLLLGRAGTQADVGC